MADTIRSTGAPASNGGASASAPRPPEPPASPPAPPVERARHIVGQLAALPRLARSAEAARDSVAERIARRRHIAQATLEEESADVAETDWARVGVFGVGVAIGALIGAGAALLLAPATGFETRTRLVRRARVAGGQAADRWEDVSDELRHRARYGARRVRRAAATSRWAVEDALEQRRRRD